MKDLLNRLQKLRDDADDCLLISRLATDPHKRKAFARLPHKRKAFARLAEDYRAMIATLETSIEEARGETSGQS